MMGFEPIPRFRGTGCYVRCVCHFATSALRAESYPDFSGQPTVILCEVATWRKIFTATRDKEIIPSELVTRTVMLPLGLGTGLVL
jgi:hypothetical protein